MNRLILSIYILMSVSLFGLSLKDELPLTTDTGKLNTAVLAQVKVADRLSIKRSDGILYKANVTEIIETPDYVKIYGVITNQENVQFGIHLIKGGHLAGVILENKTGTVYALEFSAEHQGFIFIYSAKHSKMII